MIATTDEAGRRTEFQYDGLNRQTHVILPEAVPGQPRTTVTTYDEVGNVRVVDYFDDLVQDRKVTYDYDNLNRRTKVIDALGRQTITRYDSVGNVIQITDPLGNETHYEHDGLNRVELEKQKRSDGTFDNRQFFYDPVGNQTMIVDRNDRVREFAYDAANRLTREQWRDSIGGPAVNTITSDYDAAGQLTSIADNFSHTAYTHDYAGRVLTESNAGTPNMPAVTLTLTRDAAGNRELLYSGGSLLVDYIYDARNRLDWIERPGQLAVDFGYLDNQLVQIDNSPRPGPPRGFRGASKF